MCPVTALDWPSLKPAAAIRHNGPCSGILFLGMHMNPEQKAIARWTVAIALVGVLLLIAFVHTATRKISGSAMDTSTALQSGDTRARLWLGGLPTQSKDVAYCVWPYLGTKWVTFRVHEDVFLGWARANHCTANRIASPIRVETHHRSLPDEVVVTHGYVGLVRPPLRSRGQSLIYDRSQQRAYLWGPVDWPSSGVTSEGR